MDVQETRLVLVVEMSRGGQRSLGTFIEADKHSWIPGGGAKPGIGYYLPCPKPHFHCTIEKAKKICFAPRHYKRYSLFGGALDIATEIEQQELLLVQQARQVHTITDRFSRSNTYLVNDAEHCFVIDPGSVLNTHLTLHYLQRFLHRSPSDIDLIVLTHLHPDHTAGVEDLRKACKAPVAASIVAQQLVQSWIDGHQEIRSNSGMSHFVGHMLSQHPLPGALHHLDLFPPRYDQQAQMVDIWLEDVAGLPNHLNWRVIASPGHTPESLCLYNPFSYELVCGDTVVTLEGGAALVHGSAHQHTQQMTLQTLRSLNVLYLYPGHGRPILSRHALANIRDS